MKDFKEPYYLVDFTSSICNFEIFLNDMPAFIHHEGGSMSSHYPINHFILETGKQEIKIRLLPIKGEGKLREDGYVKIKVFSYDSSTSNYDDTFEVFKYETPDLSKHELPIIEVINEFVATVPYKIEGWKNAIEQQKEMESKIQAESFYKKIYALFKEKNVNELAKLFLIKFNEVDTSMYLIEDNNQSLNNLFIRLENEKFILQDIPDLLNIQYFGGSRVLNLVRKDNLPIIYYKNNETNEEFSYPILVCKRDLNSSFEIIR
jgi:hypothetical protein